MDTEIHIALQLRHPEALHDDDKGSFVRYKSQLKPDGKNLALGINMGGDKENVKHGGWAFVHAVMRRGTQGADADLDVVSMRKISGPDCDRTGIVIAEGTSVSKCVGAEGRRWILMRMGADEQTGWTIALPMHNFGEDVFESIKNSEAIRVTGVITGRFRLHRADGQRTTAVLVCPRILTFPDRESRTPIRPLPLETDKLSESHDLYEESELDQDDLTGAEERNRQREMAAANGDSTAGANRSAGPSPPHVNEDTAAPTSGTRTPPKFQLGTRESNQGADSKEESTHDLPRRRRGATTGVETDVDTDAESDIVVYKGATALRGPTKVDTILDIDEKEVGLSGTGFLANGDDEGESEIEEYGGEDERQGGVDTDTEDSDFGEDGVGTDNESPIERSGVEAGGSGRVVMASGLDTEDEEEVESYMKVEGEYTEEMDSAEDEDEDGGVEGGEEVDDVSDEISGAESEGEGDDSEAEVNSAEESDGTDCSDLFAEEQEMEEDPEADYEQSSAGDDGSQRSESASEAGGSSEREDACLEEASSPVRSRKRRLQIHTDEEVSDDDANVYPRKRRSP